MLEWLHGWTLAFFDFTHGVHAAAAAAIIASVSIQADAISAAPVPRPVIALVDAFACLPLLPFVFVFVLILIFVIEIRNIDQRRSAVWANRTSAQVTPGRQAPQFTSMIYALSR